MAYLKFNLKKIIRNKVNIILILIPILFAVLGLVLNTNTIKTNNEIADTRETIQAIKADLPSQKNAGLEDQLLKNEQFLKFLETKQWSNAYHLKEELENNDLNGAYNVPGSDDLIQSIKRDKTIVHYLAENNIERQDTDFPTHGWDFLIWTEKMIVPYISVLIIIFILSQLFTSKFFNKLNIATLIPSNHMNKMVSDLIVGICVSVISIFIMYVAAFTGASILSGTGSFQYPYLTNINNSLGIIHLDKLLIESNILIFLTLFFIIELIYMLAQILKNNMLTTFTSIIIVLGYALMLATIEPIQKISKLIPLTYINGVSIITGDLGQQIHQNNINLNTGVLVTTIGIFVLFIVDYLIIYRENK